MDAPTSSAVCIAGYSKSSPNRLLPESELGRIDLPLDMTTDDAPEASVSHGTDDATAVRPDASEAEAVASGGARRAGLWTDQIPRTAHNQLFLNADFSKTTLGPTETWGPALRLYAHMVFADSRGAGVYWGPDKVCFYNEAFSPCIGGMHPQMMGRALYDYFPEVSEKLEPVFDKAATTARTAEVNDILLFLERNGYVEETFFVGQYIPLRGDSGEIEGFYNTVFESTAQKLYERRRRVIDALSAISPLSTSETLTGIIEALKTDPYDIPAAILYAYDEAADPGTPNLTLAGSLGVPAGHSSTPAQAHLETDGGLVSLFRKARLSGQSLALTSSNANHAQYFELFKGFEWCGYGEPSRDVLVTSLAVGDSVLGYLVQATNPRRTFEEATTYFLADLKTQIEAKWMASVTREAGERRQKAFEQRASDSERKLRDMARSAPLGMVMLDANANFEWANEQWYGITGLDRATTDMSDFRNILAEDEREANLKLLNDVLTGSRGPVTRELRLARRWVPPVKEDEDTGQASAWILTMGIPMVEHGEVKQILGYVMDISSQKWAETIQARNATAARLAKQRQEEFIDVTCHEMRNPLSAITQLADGIANGILSTSSWQEIAEEGAAAASTILTCTAHQKRVIDDVLTLSRLDFQMLSITPIIDQLAKIVHGAVEMFDGEVMMKGIDIDTVRDSSGEEAPVDYAILDSSRLQQVLINLISNAIKFVAPEDTRKITVRYGAQLCSTPELKTSVGDIVWTAPSSKAVSGHLPALEEGEQPLYLYFVIQDSGAGVPASQMKRLFQRFSQAKHRSHVSYGGSGLGLYISRQLVEKQGGRVGVASREGEGAAFAFYIESRIAHTPAQTPDSQPADPVDNAVSSVAPAMSPPETALSASAEAGAIRRRSRGEPLPLRGERQPTKRVLASVSGLHILLVEDNLINQRVLAKQLRMHDCRVTVANHGVEALQVLETPGSCDHDSRGGRKGSVNSIHEGNCTCSKAIDVIDVVLMDVEMPVMNGLQCAKRIRVLESEGALSGKLPIIALTANVRQEHRDTVLAAGMDEFLAKPVTTREVLERIGEVVKLASHR